MAMAWFADSKTGGHRSAAMHSVLLLLLLLLLLFAPSFLFAAAAYIEARLAARLRSSSLSKQHWHLPKFPFEFCGVVLPLLMLLMSAAPAEPAFLLLFLFWGSLALKLWMRLAHGPAARQHMAHMLQHMTCSRKRWVRQGYVRVHVREGVCLGGDAGVCVYHSCQKAGWR
jgi:hypothetical protein